MPLTVMYFCHECMTKKGDKPEIGEYVPITVRQRHEGELITEFVQELARQVGIHHAHRGCKNDKCDLMIPTENEKGIGFPKEAK